MNMHIGTSLHALLAPAIILISASVHAAPPQDRYIVVLKEGTGTPQQVAAEVAQRVNGRIGYVYENALHGFSITMPRGAFARISRDPRIAYIEEDRPVSILAQTTPTGIQRIFADTNPSLDIDATDDYRVDVDVAVIDTGVDFEHPDLNVQGGVDCTVYSGTGGPWMRTYYCSATEGTGGDDNQYHGTHVAGTIGAIDNGTGVVGIAPGARIWAVKVLDSQGRGFESGIVAGIDWVAAQGNIEVANMSLGGLGYSQAEYDAIQYAVNAGVAFAVSAGNDDADTADYSPASFDNVLTVSALADFDGAPGGAGSPTCRDDQDDTLADFSNWGDTVQIAAPGVCILSTYPLEEGEYGTISGTSMASPHVAGALALLASVDAPADADDVYDLYAQVINAGNDDWTDDSGDGILEPLLDVSTFSAALVETGGGSDDDPPAVSINSPSDGASFDSGETISFLGSAADDEDGDLTSSLVWTSSLDDQIGTDGSFTAVLSDGTHTITATTSDSGGNTGSDSIIITVGGSSGDEISLEVSTYRIRGIKYVDLTWSGANSTNIDVYRDGVLIATTANDGAYTDNINAVGGGSYTYKVCEEGTDTCSDTVEADF
ncbi:MAG: S8 family peptidase [Gammaproteobacteria bacterium]